MIRSSGKAPTTIVWIIALVLYVVALFGQFHLVPIPGQLFPWLWIIGFGLLLLACRVKGL